MSLAQTLLAVFVGGLALALAEVVVRFNRKRLHIRRRAAAATDEQLEAIYGLVEECGADKPVGCVLGRTNRLALGSVGLVTLPGGLEDFPWTGRVVAVDSRQKATFRFTSRPAGGIQLAGRLWRPVRVPRERLRSGRVRSIFSPNRYVAASEPLARALRDVCPEYPRDLLSYLLAAGADTYEFEPVDQARIGATAAWLQEPEWPTCDECSRRMSLILQLPGSLLSPNPGGGTFYWFGCKRHPELTRTIVQFD